MSDIFPPDDRLIGKVKISKEKKEHSDSGNRSNTNSNSTKGQNSTKQKSKASGSGRTHVGLLIKLAKEAELFRTPDHIAFADVRVGGHRETWRLRGRDFRRWLTRRFFEKTGGAPSSDGLQRA